MYHQLNKFTGRLAPAVNLQAPLYPISPAAVQKLEPPKIIHTAARLSTVAEPLLQSTKKLVPGTNVYYSTVPEHIRKSQEKFLKDNDIPVFLKGGPVDGILYRLTLILCVVGVIGVGNLIYDLGFAKK